MVIQINSRELHSYSDNDNSEPISFILSDIDIINGKEQLDIQPGDKHALVVRFSLGSAQYATMVLREIMKTETGAAHQSILSKDYNDEMENTII
jgi:tRNA pseudouridine13 synthase